MSLVVWYPFTKDTKNKGLSSDATFNGTINFLSSQFGYGLDLSKGNNVTIPELAGLKTFSISFWVKIFTDTSLSINWVNIFNIWDNNPGNSDSGGFRWQTGYGDPYVTTMGVGGPYNSSEQNICANMGIMTSEKNVWHHICAVVDYENNKVTSYLNGIVKNTTTHNGGHIWTGYMDFGSTNTRGVMNDFRIYNHALSIKEIKELAKGLILHHDLKGYGAGENILDSNSLISGVTIEEEGYRGQKVYIKDSTSTTESFMGIGRSNQVEQSTQYTFSCYAWGNDNLKSIDLYWLSDTESNKKTGASYVNHRCFLSQKKLTPNQWTYITSTFSTFADDYTGYVRFDNEGTKTEGETATLKIACPKLEKGSKATPYIPYSLTKTDIRTLPSSYAPLEYIEGTGTQYIDTGYVHKATTRIDIVCELEARTSYDFKALFGARNGSYRDNSFNLFTIYGYKAIPMFSRTGNEKQGTGLLYNEKILISAYDKTCTWYKYGSTTASGSVTTTGTADAGLNKMLLFSLNVSTTASGVTAGHGGNFCKIYSCKIWDDNGTTLVRDFIPAVRKSDSKIGLYDNVNSVFYTNAGTGEFLTSPDIIEDDLSGNGYNGTRQGVTFTADSPRYYMSTEFNASKDLVLDRIFHSGDEVSNLSLSIWAKFKADLGTSNNLWNLNRNAFWRTRSNGSSQFQSIVYMNAGYQDIRIDLTEALILNTWYNIVMTFDNGIFKCYLNSELVGTVDKTSVATTIKCADNVSRWSLGDFTYNQEKFVGNLSDFRIYAKTLTTDDVNELYKIGAQVDKTGKLYCGELVEE